MLTKEDKTSAMIVALFLLIAMVIVAVVTCLPLILDEGPAHRPSEYDRRR